MNLPSLLIDFLLDWFSFHANAMPMVASHVAVMMKGALNILLGLFHGGYSTEQMATVADGGGLP